MDEKKPTDQAPSSPPVEAPKVGDTPPAEKSVTQPSTPPVTPASATEIPVKKSSPVGKILIVLFVVVDLILAAFILYRMML